MSLQDAGYCLSALLCVLINLVTGTGKSIRYLQTPPNVLLSPRFRMLIHPPTGFDTMIGSRASHAVRRQRSKEWVLFC